MDTEGRKTDTAPELDEDARAQIREVFEEELVPKLQSHNARIGTLSCDFAGDAYADWMIHFRSSGRGFEITEYEYDPDGDSLDLDL